jgi:hypothetical protein
MGRKNKWRKERRGEPPTPFYVPGAAGDSSGDGSFANWPSTKASDKVFGFLKRLFAKRARSSN